MHDDSPIDLPQDSRDNAGSKRGILSAIFLTVFVDLLGMGIIIPILAPLLLDENGVLPEGIDFAQRTVLLGLAISAYSVFQLLSSPVMGMWSDKIGRRPVLFVSLFITIAGYLLTAWAVVRGSFWMLMAARALLGISAGNLSVMYGSIADISTPERKAKNFGLIGMAFGLGFIIGPVLGGVLSDPNVVSWFNYAVPFYFAAGLVVINMLLVWFRFPETNGKLRPELVINLSRGLGNLGRAFKLKHLRPVFFTVFLFAFGFTFFSQFVQVYLVEKFNTSQADIGLFFGYIGLWLVFAQGVILRRIPSSVEPKKVLRIVLLIQSAAFLLLMLPVERWQLYFIVPFLPMTQGLASPNLSAMLSNRARPEEQGEMLGIQQSVQASAMLITPVLGGYVIALHLSMPFILASLAALSAWGVVMRIKD
jgi:MFS transporter, DHA1 family, tetracycline resistance protein